MKLFGEVSDPASVDLDAVDLIDPFTHRDQDLHSVWHAMRRRDPVRWHPHGDRLGFWSVTTYDDGDLVMRDHTRFTSQRGTLLNLLGTDDPAGGQQMAATDPPKHTRMRGPLQASLTVKSVERYRDRIRDEVRRILAPAAEGGVYDFAEQMTTLPMAVTGTIMGLPPADWPRLTRLTLMSIAPDDPEYALPEGPEATLVAAHRGLFAYFQDVVVGRRKELGDDLLSTLLTIEIDGRRLGAGEVLSNCYSLLLGANVTTPYVPSAAMALMLSQPELAGDLLGHPELVHGIVEESLRWSSPATHFMRYTTRDVELSGVPIPAENAVVVWLGSANRDERAFPDPFRFDIRRRPNRHIAFGAGPHYCVGHTVARVSLRVFFEELIAGFEGFEPAGDAEHLCSNFVAGIKHLPIVAHARPGAAQRYTAALARERVS
jgi:cytochrome P450